MERVNEHVDDEVEISADKTESIVPLLERNREALANWQRKLEQIITEPDTAINKQAAMLNFRELLNVCFVGELSEERSISILGECRNLEENIFKRRLLSFEQVNQIPEDNRPLAARLAVLLGIMYYRGEGIPQDYSIARRYFKLGMDLNQPEAFLLAAFMAERGHGEENEKKNAELREHYINVLRENIRADVSALKKAIIDVPQGVPAVTPENFNLNFRDESDSLVLQHWYPGHRVCNAGKKLDLVCSPKVSSAEEMFNTLKPQVIEVAEGLYRAHQTYLRSGGFLKERKLVATTLAKLYNERLKAYENYKPDTRVANETDGETTSRPLLEADTKAQEAIRESLQEIALYAQYYYGLIDPSIFGQLRDSTIENPDIIVTLILQDKVSSARSKMKRILELTEWELPDNLFATDLQLLENLGHIAYQAVNDCLALISNGEPQHEADLVEEMIDYQNFADAVLSRLKKSITPFSSVDNKREMRGHVSNLDRRAEKLSRLSYQKMIHQGFEGFARAMRFLMGKTPGSQELVLSERVANLKLLYYFLDQQALLMIEPSELSSLKVEVRRLVPSKERSVAEDQRIDVLDEELDELSMVASSAVSKVLKEEGPATQDKTERRPLKPASLLSRLQHLADFCRIVGQANITLPAELRALSRKELFELFEKGEGEKSEIAIPLLKELFILFNQHNALISPIEIAIKRFESEEYQPSRFNFFSSTFGKGEVHAKQLADAKALVRDCERCIFDRLAILSTIKDFLEHSKEEQHALSFALVLMKEMPTYDGEKNLNDFLLQFTSYCDREAKKALLKNHEAVRQIEMLNMLCKQFFDVRTGLSIKLIKDFFSFLKASPLISTIFPDETFTEAENKDRRILRKKHLLFALYCYYKRSEEEFLELYEYLRELEPRYFPQVPGQGIEVWKAWIISFVKHTRGQIIDKLQHFNHYCYKQLEKNAPVPESMISFENYCAKAGLNRAITQAWEERKKVPKGMLPTLMATRSKDPEEVFYLRHINKCLSIHKEDNFRSCLQLVYHFLKDPNTPITKDSYAYFLMDSLAVELDRLDKRNNFKAKMDEWKARFTTDIKHIRLEFTDQLRACYFNYNVVTPVASTPSVL